MNLASKSLSMHKVIVVSRCIHKALKNTRSIVDKYGIRISDKSWSIDLTQEGLDDLVKNLRKSARKNSAIAIYFLKNSKMRIYIIIGKREEFGADGSCPIETTKRKNIYFENGIKYTKLLEYKKIMEYVGFAHDIGKVSENFQKLLRTEKGKNRDIFRHELLSSFNILELSSDEMMGAFKGKNFPLKKKNNSQLFFINAIIATHHKIFSPKENDSTSISLDRHIVNFSPTATEIKNLSKHKKHKSYKKIEDKLALLKEAIINTDIILKTPHYFYFRLALMLADHYISSKKNEDYEIPKGELLAKSKSQGNETLYNHLYGVSKMASYIIEDLTSVKKKFFHLQKEELSNVLTQSRGRFVWQNKSVKMAVSNKGYGNFILLSSSTGSGKTKTALRLATELAGEEGLRLNVALGLRTLTLQTSKSYQKMLGIPSDYIATLIGSIQTKKIDSIYEGEDDEKETYNMDGGISDDENIPKYIKNEARNISQKKMLYTPIVVSTIDYLIGASLWATSKHIASTIRLINSDLILDEVDMYGTEDIKSIQRLVYLTGLFGRNIIITTATAMPAIVEAIYKSYKQGFNDFMEYSSDNKNLKVHLLSDYHNDSFESNKIEDDLNNILTYSKKNAFLIEENHFKEKYNKAEIKDINTENITNYILELHNSNAIKFRNIKTSIGVVRIKYTKNAFDVYKKLQNEAETLLSDGVQLNIVFYHARLLLSVRSFIEHSLDEALLRDKDEDPYLVSKLFSEAYNKKNENITDIITVVVVTPVEEVGRDHDFDWAIIEPTSSRSIVQMVGRVNRHRKIPVSDTNILIMNSTIDGKYDYIANTDCIDKIYPQIQDNLSASTILNPFENVNSLPFFENNIINANLKNYTEFYKTPYNESCLTQWRKSKEKNVFCYDVDENKLKGYFYDVEKKKSYVVESVKMQISEVIDTRFNFIHSENFNEIIEDIRSRLNVSKDTFTKEYMQVEHYKKEGFNFSEVFGII